MASFRKLVPLLAALAFLAVPRVSRADEGEKLFTQSCSGCHNAKTRPLDDKRMTREKWKETVERMEGLGADIPGGKKLADLLDYLARTHGPQSPAPEGKPEGKK